MDKLKWGVESHPLKSISNNKGNVLHGLKKSDIGFKDFGEAYFSCISPGFIKGWKRHKEMTLNLIVPVGLVKFVIFSSKENGEPDQSNNPIEYIIGREKYSRLTIPPGLWVAFHGLGDCESILLNVASHEHDPDESDNLEVDELDYKWT